MSSWIDCKFGEGYEIFTKYPFYIRKKKNGKIIKESLSHGYVCVHLNGVLYLKHRIVATHFIPNDEPLIKTEVDHINRDRTDYHLENLRWCSQKENLQNKSSHLGVDYEFIEYGDDEEEDLTQVTDYGRHEFEQYLYYYSAERNRFLMDTGVNYRVLHINFDKRNGCAFVCARNKENKNTRIYFTKFKKLYGFD